VIQPNFFVHGAMLNSNTLSWGTLASALCIVLLTACASRPQALQRDDYSVDGPQQTVERHLLALLAGDWETSAALARPDELAANRHSFQPLFMSDTAGFLAQRVLRRQRTDLEQLSDVEFNALLWGFHVGLASQGTALSRFTGVDVLAVAQPAPDTAYVIHRWRLPPAERPIRGANVTKVVRLNGRWYLDMLADFTGLRETLAQ
jgi:hypothetical protein